VQRNQRPRRGQASRAARGAAVVASAALVVGLASAAPSAAAADGSGAGTTAGTIPAGGPAIAADAPWTKTVRWIVDQMTPAEKVTVMKGGTDPDNHGQAGYLAPVARLGIPEIRHVDAMGINVRSDATAYPSRLAAASSFDRSLYVQMGSQIGKEGLASDVDLIYGPQVDMARFPSWNRNISTNGEDSYLSSQFAATEINAIQSTGLLAQVKHVSMYNGQSQSVPSLVSSQAAHELYLAPAQSAIEVGNVSSLMCSYATFQIVGEQDRPDYACSNKNLETNIVKGEFGLKGFITSDYGGSKAITDLLAGMDQEFATNNFNPANLVPKIDTTSSSYDPAFGQAANESVARIVYQYERFGLLDNSKIPAAYRSPVPQHGDVTDTDNSSTVDKTAGIELSRSAAERSAVLLKNEGKALPLSTSQKVAIVGPASTIMPAAPGGERSRGFGDRNLITPIKAIQGLVGSANATSVPGVDWYGTTVPADNLFVGDDTSGAKGLTLSGTDASGSPITPTTVTSVDGKQTNLQKGGKYTWTGYIDVPTADTYQLLIQRPYGDDSGDRSAYNGGVAPEGRGGGPASSMSMSIDGVAQTISSPGSNLLQNDIPDGQLASNGQYLGKDNQGVRIALTAGLHAITLGYNPTATTATTPTLRLSWNAINKGIADAAAAASTADETVIFVDDSVIGNNAGNADGGSGVKSMTDDQNKLVNDVADAAHAAGNKVVVVMNSNSAVQMTWAAKADAILEMWYPGQEGGTASANLLYGKANPSGSLPITFPVDNDHSSFTGHPERTVGSQDAGETTTTIKWSDGVNVGYRWYTNPAVNTQGYKPLFAFGHGLSYTTFDYSGLKVANASDGGLDVTFTVKNTGAVAGGVSPQIYLGASPDLAAPTYDSNGLVVKGFEQSTEKLVQFDHVNLAAGASKTETLHVDKQQVSAWDMVAQQWVVGTGARTVSLAAASDDIRQRASVVVPATPAQPALHAPVASIRSGATSVHGTQFSKGAVTLGWTAATPSASLRGYQVLDGATVVKTLPASATSSSLTLTEGSHALSVRALAASPSVTGGDVTSAAVRVTVDKTAPTVTIKKPGAKASKKAATKVKGKVKDAGVGARSVTVKAVEKHGKKWFAYKGGAWKKAASKAKAFKKATAVKAKVKGASWKVKLAKAKKGKLIIKRSGADRLGNTSAVKTSKTKVK